MMKYRVLTKAELEPLNEEFLKYLLVANITPENWEQLKLEDQAASLQHIETFSDLVFDKILKELSFVDILSKDRVEVYQTLQESILMFSMENKNLGSFDFLKEDWSKLDLLSVNIIQGKKAYAEDREQELFALLQRENASISDGTLFKKIALLSVAS